MALIGALLMHILPEVFDGPLTLTLGSIDECPQVQSPQVKSPQVGSTQVECTQVESPQVVLCLTALGTLLATCTLLTSLFCFYERNFALLSFWPFMFCALAACLLINVNNDKALVMLSAAPMMFIVGYMVLVSMFKGRCIKQVDKSMLDFARRNNSTPLRANGAIDDKHTHVE